jgi:hypothetical protein
VILVAPWIALVVVAIQVALIAVGMDVDTVDAIVRHRWDVALAWLVTVWAVPHAIWLGGWFGTRNIFDRRVHRALYATVWSFTPFLIAGLLWGAAAVV